MSLAKTADDLTFQLTRSRGAWPFMYLLVGYFHNFNSHAHVERDFLLSSTFTILVISTHTLTWSVTGTLLEKSRSTSFQLTRSRGAWRVFEIFVKFFTNFNSHAHVERDYVCGNGTWKCGISTHTLTWSVTVRHFTADFLHCNFNSHAHVERDGKILILH